MENIIHRDFSFTARARLKENDTREKHEKNKNNATTTHRTLTLLLETTFKRTDCATADWVTENIMCVWVFKWVFKVSTWVSFMARYPWFFLSFRLKTAAFSLPFGVFVSTSREREKNVSFREKQTLSRRRRYAHKYFFFAERKQAEQLYKFCFFVCLCFFSFVRFTRERLAF